MSFLSQEIEEGKEEKREEGEKIQKTKLLELF